MCGVVDVAGLMASLKRIRAACERYGLAVSRRTRSKLWAVYRPFTRNTISVVDIRDIAGSEVEEFAAQWALADLFDNPST